MVWSGRPGHKDPTWFHGWVGDGLLMDVVILQHILWIEDLLHTLGSNLFTFICARQMWTYLEVFFPVMYSTMKVISCHQAS